MGAVPSGIIFAWPSTAASIPAGWSRVAALNGKYVRGAAAAGGTDGAPTHTHTSADHSHVHPYHTHPTSGTTGDASAHSLGVGLPPGAGANWYDHSVGHTHGFSVTGAAIEDYVLAASVTWAGISNDPSFWLVIWIESDGSTGVPDGAIGFWADEDLPTDWTQPTNGKNRFLKGAAAGNDGGGTGGGTLSHTHTATGTHTHSCGYHRHPLATVWAPTTDENLPNTMEVAGYHYHVWPSEEAQDLLLPATPTLQWGTMNEPPWKKLAIILNDTGDEDTPQDIIGIWDGAADDIPGGWRACDGTHDTPDLNDDKFIKGANLLSEIGNTGGSAAGHAHTGNLHTHYQGGSHTHGVGTVAGYLGETALVKTGSTEQATTTSHTHTAGSISMGGNALSGTGLAGVDAPSATTVPPYIDVIFIQHQYEPGISTDTNLFQQSFRAVADATAGNVIVETQDLPGGAWSDPIEPTEDDGTHSPSLECLADGRLRLAIMDAAGDRQEMVSTDDGETWEAA